jgi:hypothetical protein
VVLTVAALGCGSSVKSTKTIDVPADGAAVVQAVNPALTSFRLLVQRSSVAPHSGPRGGTEANLYLRPARTESVGVYAKRFMPLAAGVVPTVFAQYPGIDWIDLCQEPAKSSGAWETVPVTRLEISREGAGRIDWQRADLATLLALDHTRPLEVSIEWHNGVGG